MFKAKIKTTCSHFKLLETPQQPNHKTTTLRAEEVSV